MAKTRKTKAKSAKSKKVCGKETEVYSRVVGYFRPIANWNIGKKEEFAHRLEYEEKKSAEHHFKGEK